jgi:hypothetical protein
MDRGLIKFVITGEEEYQHMKAKENGYYLGMHLDGHAELVPPCLEPFITLALYLMSFHCVLFLSVKGLYRSENNQGPCHPSDILFSDFPEIPAVEAVAVCAGKEKLPLPQNVFLVQPG